MRANNTSCFNFRFQTGSTTRISKHGMGLAIDINPLYNPYVRRRRDGTFHVEPSEGRPYAFDRARRSDIPYKIDRNDEAYRLFHGRKSTRGRGLSGRYGKAGNRFGHRAALTSVGYNSCINI